MVIFHSYVSLPEGNMIQKHFEATFGDVSSNFWKLQPSTGQAGYTFFFPPAATIPTIATATVDRLSKAELDAIVAKQL